MSSHDSNDHSIREGNPLFAYERDVALPHPGSFTNKRVILMVVALYYAVTWIGGSNIYSRDVARNALALHESVKHRTIQEIETAKVRGANEDDLSWIRLHGHSEKGPWSKVFCVPLLPGVLLADKAVEVGPLRGYGARKLVFYYGWGSIELWRLCELYRV